MHRENSILGNATIMIKTERSENYFYWQIQLTVGGVRGWITTNKSNRKLVKYLNGIHPNYQWLSELNNKIDSDSWHHEGVEPRHHSDGRITQICITTGIASKTEITARVIRARCILTAIIGSTRNDLVSITAVAIKGCW